MHLLSLWSFRCYGKAYTQFVTCCLFALTLNLCCSYYVQYALSFVITCCLLALQLNLVVHVLYNLLWVVVMIFWLFTLAPTLTCWNLVQYYFELLWRFLLSTSMNYCFDLPMLCSVYYEFLLQWLVVGLYLLLLCTTYTMQYTNDLLHLGYLSRPKPKKVQSMRNQTFKRNCRNFFSPYDKINKHIDLSTI